MGICGDLSAGEAVSLAEQSCDRFGDIEEALAELFEAKSLLSVVMQAAPPEAVAANEKLMRACELLDRPWT